VFNFNNVPHELEIGDVVPLHAVEGYRENSGVAKIILNSNTRWK
jgi:hypothetical protein